MCRSKEEYFLRFYTFSLYGYIGPALGPKPLAVTAVLNFMIYKKFQFYVVHELKTDCVLFADQLLLL